MTATVSDVTDAVLAVLRATDILVGDGEQPAGGGWQGEPGISTFVPYVTLHEIPGGILDGSLAEPFDDAEIIYQPTCVGATRDQTGKVADRIRTAFLANGLSLSNRYAMLVSVDALMGTRRDDTAEPVVWISTDRFRCHVTPSS